MTLSIASDVAASDARISASAEPLLDVPPRVTPPAVVALGAETDAGTPPASVSARSVVVSSIVALNTCAVSSERSSDPPCVAAAPDASRDPSGKRPSSAGAALGYPGMFVAASAASSAASSAGSAASAGGGTPPTGTKPSSSDSESSDSANRATRDALGTTASPAWTTAAISSIVAPTTPIFASRSAAPGVDRARGAAGSTTEAETAPAAAPPAPATLRRPATPAPAGAAGPGPTGTASCAIARTFSSSASRASSRSSSNIPANGAWSSKETTGREAFPDASRGFEGGGFLSSSFPFAFSDPALPLASEMSLNACSNASRPSFSLRFSRQLLNSGAWTSTSPSVLNRAMRALLSALASSSSFASISRLVCGILASRAAAFARRASFAFADLSRRSSASRRVARRFSSSNADSNAFGPGWSR